MNLRLVTHLFILLFGLWLFLCVRRRLTLLFISLMGTRVPRQAPLFLPSASFRSCGCGRWRRRRKKRPVNTQAKKELEDVQQHELRKEASKQAHRRAFRKELEGVSRPLSKTHPSLPADPYIHKQATNLKKKRTSN